MNLNLLFNFVNFSPLLLRALRAENFLDTNIFEPVHSPELSPHIASHHRQLQTVGTFIEVVNAGDLVRITGENLNWTSAQPSDYSIFYLPLPPVEGTVLPQDSTCFVYTLTPTFVQTACSYSALVNYYFVDCIAETSVYSSSACTNAVTGGPSFAPTVAPTLSPTATMTWAPTTPTIRPTNIPTSAPIEAPSVLPTLLPTPQPVGILSGISNNGGKLRLDGAGLTWLGTSRSSYTVYQFASPPMEGDALTFTCTITSITASAVLTGCNYGSATIAKYWIDCAAGATIYASSVCTNAVSLRPTFAPTATPTMTPTRPTAEPTFNPTTPTVEPTLTPTITPSDTPTLAPTLIPTGNPSEDPTLDPTARPSIEPTVHPTAQPTSTDMPTYPPSASPSRRSTRIPTTGPSFFRPPLTGHNATHNATSSSPDSTKNKVISFVESPAGISVMALGGVTVAALIGRTLWGCYGKRTQRLQNTVVINPISCV